MAKSTGRHYYINVTSNSGSKFEIHYNKIQKWFVCTECKRQVKLGYESRQRLDVKLKKIGTNGQYKEVVTNNVYKLEDEKSYCDCDKNILEGKKKCDGVLRYAGYMLYVVDVTKRTITSMGQFQMASGSVQKEYVFAKNRGEIEETKQQLIKKYQEM